LNAQIEQAQASGQVVSPSWVKQQWRYQSFLQQIQAEFDQYGRTLDATVNARQFFEARQGASDAGAMIGAQFNRLPVRALENLADGLRESSPLVQLLNTFGRDAAQDVSGVLLNALALGKNPRAIASEIKDALGVPLHRALTLSRTEANRAYRQATFNTYQDNGIEGYYWVSSKSRRTCLACLALDGQFFPMDRPQPSHVNCRCTSIPAIAPPKARQTGEQWFNQQPDEVQRQMMSGVAFDAFKAGKISLRDFVGRADSRKWGQAYYELSYKRAANGDAKFPNYKPTVTVAPVKESTPVIALSGLSAAEARAKLQEIGAAQESRLAAARLEYDKAAIGMHKSLAEPDRMYQGLRFDEWQEMRNKAYGLENAVRAESNHEARNLLYQDTKADFQVNIVKKSPRRGTVAGTKLEEKWKQGIESFKRLVGAGKVDGLSVGITRLRKNARAYHLEGQGIFVAPEDKPEVICHELGHWLEGQNKAIFDAVTAFYNRRTEGEHKVQMSKFGRGYGRDEITKPDKFMNPYMGKVYNHPDGSRRASEIVSMGLEYMHSKPIEFAKTDPDYFDFMYDLLRM
jgi:SPP1 gp7 family putative phage head morphogenesis protein